MANYHITINGTVVGECIERELECSCGKGTARHFIFKLKNNAVEIEYQMSKTYSLDYIIAKSVIFREALTKAYLFHALSLNSALIINHISINVAGNNYELDSRSNVNFPFVFSLMEDENLHLKDSFSVLPEYVVINSIKYNQKELRFASLASYLSAKSKNYQIDRFNALWTSINALYNYVALCYENRLVDQCNGVSRANLPRNLQLYCYDSNGISALMCYLKNGCYKQTQRNEKAIKNNNEEAFQTLAALFQRLSDEEIVEVYRLCKVDLDANGIVYNLPPEYEIIDQVARLYRLPSYVFILLQYSYSLRCELFHGNKATPIICSYNDRCIGELRVVNYFLEEFLGNEIPLLYTTNYYANMHNDIVALMNSGTMPNCNQNAYNTYIREHQ